MGCSHGDYCIGNTADLLVYVELGQIERGRVKGVAVREELTKRKGREKDVR